MKTYEVIMSYDSVAALLFPARLCGVEGHSGPVLKGTVNHDSEPISPTLLRFSSPSVRDVLRSMFRERR